MGIKIEPLTECLRRLEQAPALACKLADIGTGGGRTYFEHVHDSAWGALGAVLANRTGPGRIWFICPDVRTQERFYRDLTAWQPEALFIPTRELHADAGLEEPELAGERLAALDAIARHATEARILVLTGESLKEQVPAPDGLAKARLVLKRGRNEEMETVVRRLAEAGYERVGLVTERGQFAVRGGIMDVFSWQHGLPVRLEWFGDQLESIRRFDLDQQVSVEQVDRCEILTGDLEGETCSLADYIGAEDVVVELGAESRMGQVVIVEEGGRVEGPEDYRTAFHPHDFQGIGAGDLALDEGKRKVFFDQLANWRERGWEVWVVGEGEGELERFRELAGRDGGTGLHYGIAHLVRGFLYPEIKLVVLSEAEIFGRYRHATALRSNRSRSAGVRAQRLQTDYSDFKEGDLVVHLEMGVGRFKGLRRLEEGDGRDVLEVEFADEAKLFVPLEQSYLVSRYVGMGKKEPPLSRLGDGRWGGAKRAAARAVEDYAARMLEIQARRESAQGHAFAPDTKWQLEFEEAFPYRETPDQLTAIRDCKEDMESSRPMDRLICGDVGFGKTEVAIRAAFKAVMGGKQVAVLTPTTVLAQQHYQTFRERMSEFPVVIEMLSRFRSQREQRTTVAKLKTGEVDIVIGTHRLLSKDVAFRDLGLVVLDEEQRFGVRHKEVFKERFELVDVVTLSATPIPRTLYQSMTGLKHLSTIETPPPNRFPVETMVAPYDERLIRTTMERELARQGQVYYLHNRVKTIHAVKRRLEELCPRARMEIGHGQMGEDELEAVMRRFVEGEIDVLVCTTIIESGLDIPNANTIIIDRADRFGLADLYQLRGRVGRAQHKAYACLLLPPSVLTVGEARKRLNAIKQYSTLGAGFKVAMRDLEIRGAGSLLGTAQSGHITAVGFELYCSLLKQAVARLRGEKVVKRPDLPVRIDFLVTNEAEFRALASPCGKLPAFLNAAYIADPMLRLQAYRRVAEAMSITAVDGLRKQWRDRFGRLPGPVENLLTLARIRITAAARSVQEIEVVEGKLMVRRGNDYVMLPGGRFPRLTSKTPKLRLSEILQLLRKL